MLNSDGPRKDLVDKTKGALTGGSDNRQRLFEAREALQELMQLVEDGPRPGLSQLCKTIQNLISQLLRSGDLEEAGALSVAVELVDYVGIVLSSPAPPIPVEPEHADEKVFKVNREAFSLESVNESRLGEILVKMGAIDANHLDRGLVLQKVVHQRLGDVLVSMGALKQTDLDQALEVQREETIRLAGIDPSAPIPDEVAPEEPTGPNPLRLSGRPEAS